MLSVLRKISYIEKSELPSFFAAGSCFPRRMLGQGTRLPARAARVPSAAQYMMSFCHFWPCAFSAPLFSSVLRFNRVYSYVKIKLH